MSLLSSTNLWSLASSTSLWSSLGILDSNRRLMISTDTRKRPKMVHRPFLQITLSTKPLGLEQGPKGRNVTCQYVMVRRRKSKLNSGNEGDAGPSVPDSEQSSKIVAVEGASGGQEKMGAAKERERKGENAIKRKAASSQPDATRGGKKRKK